MKRFICVLLTCILMLSLCACTQKDSETQNLNNTVGEVNNLNVNEPIIELNKGYYLTAEETAGLDIFDTTEDGEIYFQLVWFRANSFGGVAKTNENTAEFEILGYDAQRAKGALSVEDNEIILELSECTFNYIEAGTYRFAYSGPTYQDSTYCDLSEDAPHTKFKYFLKDFFAEDNITWEFLGIPGDVFTVPGESYTSSFDLYKVETSENKFKYYALTNDFNSGVENGFVAYEVTKGGDLVQVWKSVGEDEKTETTPDVIASESNYDKYKDKTVQDIRNEYGQEKESQVENCRKVLVYDNSNIPHFYYTYHLGSGEEAFKSLQREPVAPSNMFVTGFVASSKGIEVYKGIKIGDNFNDAMSLLGAITEKRDPLSAISYPHGGRIDWILDDKGTILYASIIYGH